jgi:short-subunit dehydrogenase
MESELAGTAALVTGASSGIGAATAASPGTVPASRW